MATKVDRTASMMCRRGGCSSEKLSLRVVELEQTLRKIAERSSGHVGESTLLLNSRLRDVNYASMHALKTAEIEIRPEDLHIATTRSGDLGSGLHGAACVHVHITHRPTGLSGEATEKSELRAKEAALSALRVALKGTEQ